MRYVLFPSQVILAVSHYCNNDGFCGKWLKKLHAKLGKNSSLFFLKILTMKKNELNDSHLSSF